MFASQRFHKVFYEVENQYATAERPAYRARSGYLSTTLSQGLSKQIFNQVNMFLFFTYTNLKGNSNATSPLFRKENNFSGAIGFVWWFFESDSLEKS